MLLLCNGLGADAVNTRWGNACRAGVFGEGGQRVSFVSQHSTAQHSASQDSIMRPEAGQASSEQQQHNIAPGESCQPCKARA